MTKEDMPTMAQAYSFKNLDPHSVTREVKVSKEVMFAELRIHQDEVCQIIERHLRDKYSLDHRYEINVMLLDIYRTDDAAKVTVEIDKSCFPNFKGERFPK